MGTPVSMRSQRAWAELRSVETDVVAEATKAASDGAEVTEYVVVRVREEHRHLTGSREGADDVRTRRLAGGRAIRRVEGDGANEYGVVNRSTIAVTYLLHTVKAYDDDRVRREATDGTAATGDQALGVPHDVEAFWQHTID